VEITIMNRAFALAGALLALAACGPTEPTSDGQGGPPQSIVRGTEEQGLPQIVLIHSETASGSIGRCSGTYIAPRMVLTAAHCVRAGVLPTRFFVYHGDDYWTDRAQLPEVPAPGQPSKWARVEGWLVHPDYDPNLHHPDLAVLYLDRALPFAPLPISPWRLSDRWIGKQAQLVGWGGSRALTADITQVEGSGVKRSGWAPIAGSPTEADYHPDDPNAGMLDPEIRRQQLKTIGTPPHANTCAGDSGGALLVEKDGTKWLAGVIYFGGLWCEDYGLSVRLETFLPFLADAFRYAGFQPVTPAVTCVDEREDGTLRAYFGYENENRLSVNVPYGPFNRMPRDADGARPSIFAPGTHTPAFGVTFAPGERLDWQLLPLPGGPHTRLRVDASAARCAPGLETACLHGCEAMAAATCDPAIPDPLQPLDACMADCMSFGSSFPECEAEFVAWYECAGRLDPADPASWACFEYAGQGFVSAIACGDQELAFWTCLGF
jgi:hypothetical protein